jgi:hypothetical protein
MSEYATAVAKYAVKIPHELSNEQAARKYHGMFVLIDFCLSAAAAFL